MIAVQVLRDIEHVPVQALAALLVCEGGPRTTLTCQKKIYINNYFKLICSETTLT